jgi:CubicO group peptidase (beta-lactamase class C family)
MFTNTKNYIDALVKNKGIPYIDIGVMKGGLPLFRYLAGDGREELNGKEKLLIFSATKPMTVVMAMRLIEEGKMKLEDKVSTFLPEYESVYLLNEKGEKVSPKKDITILHLLTMTAGLTYDYKSYPIEEMVKSLGGNAMTREIVSCFVKTPLAFEPGSDRRYSLCHDVLGAVIEVVSGKTLGEYLDEVIVKPLGLKNTGFCGYEKTANLYESKGGKIEKREKDLWFKFSKDYQSGGAGLVSTVDDYLLFASALANNGEINGYRLLKEETIKEIKKERLKAFNVENKFTCVQGSDYGYGLGVRTRNVKTDWGLPKEEFGWDGAAGSYLLVDTDNGISIFMGMHVINWPEVFKGEHLKIVENIYKAIKI